MRIQSLLSNNYFQHNKNTSINPEKPFFEEQPQKNIKPHTYCSSDILFYSGNIAFGKNLSSENFYFWLKQKGINPQDESELKNFIDHTITESNYIGSGTVQQAYKIQGNNDFIIKIPNDDEIKIQKFKTTEDEFKGLNLGQQVASIGNVKICKRQTGTECSIPYKNKISPDANLKEIYIKHLRRTQGMPQKSYDELAELFALLNSKEKFFDYYNPNNLLVDTNTKKFNMVDDLNEAVNDDEKNTVLSMLNPLIDIRNISNFKNNNEIKKMWQEIIIKCMIASQKANLPPPTQNISSFEYLMEVAEIK